MKLDIRDMFDGYLDEAVSIAGEDTPSAERIKELTMNKIRTEPKKRRGWRTRTILIAAALAITLLTVSVMALETKNMMDGTTALRILNRELRVMNELGIITKELEFSRGELIIDLEGAPMHFQLFKRDDMPTFSLITYGDAVPLRADVNVNTGKIVSLTLTAPPGPDEKPSRELPYAGKDGGTCYFYANFQDLLEPGVTLGEFSGKLCEYWDYSGYTLPYADPDKPLTDYCQNRVEVYFEGDEAGVPQYIELYDFANGATILFGVRHSLG